MSQLPVEEAQSRQRPERFWSVEDVWKLTCIHPRGETSSIMGERVVFKDKSRAQRELSPVSWSFLVDRRTAALNLHGITFVDQASNVVIPVDALTVTATRSRVEILWQDNTRQWLLSTEIVPYVNTDEYDCW